jgi:hypothetical protein
MFSCLGVLNASQPESHMHRNPKLVCLIVAVFGLALALPVAMTVTSRIAHASGYIVTGGDSSCDPTPNSPCE